MKKNLQETTDYKVMGVKECLDALGWSYYITEESFNNIQCPCGGEMDFRGFIGTEIIECLGCGKHMIDLFSPIPIENGVCSIFIPKDYEIEGDKHWIVIDNNGGIKI
jgi:hypothetical protein